MPFFNNASVAAVIAGLFTLMVGLLIFRLTHNKEEAIRKSQLNETKLKVISCFKSEVIIIRDKLAKLLFDNCFSATHESLSGTYLMRESNIYYPYPTSLHCSTTNLTHFPIGLTIMSKEFNETLSSILKDTHTTTEVASFGELKLLIFKLADLVQFSNELISISEWLEVEIEDPLEIKKHINEGVSMYISKYEGLYHVPWLKPLNQIDKPYARMLDKYYAALNNSNDTGVYF